MEGSIATCQIAFSFNTNSGNMAWPKVKSGYKYRRSDKTLMSLDSHATTPLSINVEPPNPSHTLLNVLSGNSSTDINCSQSPTISSRSYDSNPSAASLGSPSYSSERSHSPSPPPPPRVFKPCVVCEDKSSGYHYGVSSCEGCKGFFRRSVQKNMQYQCHKDGNCEINKLTRNRCQFCRLKKCFEKGMSKDSVRNDRNKKRKKPEECSTTTQSLPEISSKSEEIIKQIVAAHNTTQPDSYSNGVKNDPDLVDLYEQMLASHRATQSTTVPSDGEPSSPSEDRETLNSIRRGFELWEQVTELSSQGIIRIVDFAKKLPNFQNLTVSDQMTLLKGACLEVMILRLTSRYNSEDDTIVFHNGTVVFRQEMAELGGIMDSVFQFAASLSKMGVDETELAMLSAVCLISGDRSGLQEVDAIDKMQEPVLVALKQYMIRRRPSNPFTFPKLLMKLTDLRSISVKASTRITFYYDKKQKRLVFKNSELSPADHDVQSRISSDVNDIFGIVHTFKDLKINCIEEALITLWLLVNPPPDVAKFLDSYDTDKPITST